MNSVRIKKIEFRLGSSYLTLEVPPFYINFEKRSFGSIMARRNLPREGVAIYIYVTRRRQVEKLLLLKRLHPDLFLPDELKESAAVIENLSPEEFEGFVKTVKLEGFIRSLRRLEKQWEYGGKGIWLKKIGPFTLYMILIIKESRWTVRPAISKEGVEGYGFEIPVDTKLKDAFLKELKEGELEEIHDHQETQHFHLKVESLERCVHLAKGWDYYFSTRTRWRQTVFISKA
ncbi:MAG: hypothetical protein RMJ07_06610 [Nitrososphaerota archaeon]|nr:hypothetical protein [Candidatus Bathyarchaeota archaeon]MDW8049326.1 hypothetical protein [Nitrososphaerota archaeon]